MCEHCRECGIISVERYEADEDEICEYMDEDVDLSEEDALLSGCSEKAQYLVVETMVEDHLCSDHVAKVQSEDADADLFAESIGLGSSRLLPIEEKYTGLCEYFDPLNPDPVACTKQATHARLLEFETLYCEEHMKKYQKEAHHIRPSS